MCKICDFRDEMIDLAKEKELTPHEFYEVCVGVVLLHSAFLSDTNPEKIGALLSNVETGEIITYFGAPDKLSEKAIYKLTESLKAGELDLPKEEKEIIMTGSAPKAGTVH